MSKKSLILVLIQFSCFAFFIYDGIFANSWFFYIQILGFAVSVWGVLTMKLGNFNVQPEVKTTAKMITAFPYSIIRNPMHIGLLLFFGAAVFTKYTILRLVILIILLIVFILKIRMEETFLEKRFGKNYLDYKQKTFRLIPFVY